MAEATVKTMRHIIRDHALRDAPRRRLEKDAVLNNFDYERFYRTRLAKCEPTTEAGEIAALCPFHNDKSPSFNANVGTGLYFCHACEARGDIIAFVREKDGVDYQGALRVLAEFTAKHTVRADRQTEVPERKSLPESPAKRAYLTNEFVYQDADGEPLFSVFRFEKEGHRKTVRQGRCREGNEHPELGLPEGVRLVPFNVPAVAKADTVFIVEGENKVLALKKWRLTATCNPGGAGKWRDGYSAYLKGKHVVILPDNDRAGKKHAEDVQASAKPLASSVKVLELPGLPEKGDIVDWINAGGSRKEFLALVENAPEITDVPPKEERPSLRTYTGQELLSQTEPPWRVDRLLPQTGLAMIYGKTGSGKTFLTLDLALQLASGREGDYWFGREIVPCPVMYINLESSWGLKRRLEAWRKQNGAESIPDKLSFVVDDVALNDADSVDAIVEVAPKNGMVVIDTLQRASPGADENSTRDMGTILNAAHHIARATNGLVILVAHPGKGNSEGPRGSSAQMPTCDCVIEIIKNSDGKRTLNEVKVKEGADGRKTQFQLIPVTVGHDQKGREITSCCVEFCGGEGKEDSLTDSEKTALDALTHACEVEGADGVSLEDWRKQVYKKHVGGTTNAKKTAFLRARNGLEKKGRIKVSNDLYTPVK